MYELLVGDVRERLREVPAESVQTVITSPPYYALRDYGAAGQIGLEPSLDEYVAALVETFREVRRVLRGDGTLWLNLGDSYQKKTKQLLGVPWRVALALQADGWTLRSAITWQKPNCLPEAVADRPTNDSESVFLLSKSRRYFYDAEAVREPCQSGKSDRKKMAEARERIGGKAKTLSDVENAASQFSNVGQKRSVGDPARGRNLRSTWRIATASFPGAHFAVMPAKLVEPCVRAGTSERGQCSACGSPWKRATVGWEPSCQCDAGEPVPQTVLDPFAGTGTVGVVSLLEGRRFLGVELNEQYAEMARERIHREAGLFSAERRSA